jgi:hypothetical protein
MGMRILLLTVCLSGVLLAQPTCPETPLYSTCDLVFELNDGEAADHPNPYMSVELYAEVRSPEHQTYLLHAFWDGGRRMVIRAAPVIAGQWDYKVTSNVARFDGMLGSFSAIASDSKGFVKVANFRHFAYTTGGVKMPPHLWMGDTNYRFAAMDRSEFDRMVNTRAEQKFNHIRGFVFGNLPGVDAAFTDPKHPNPEYFGELDDRIRYMNQRGISADLILGGDQNHLAEFFPTWQDRQRYVRYVVARYAPMNITWQGVLQFDGYENARAFMKEIGGLLKKFDPYQHPRSTDATLTSSPLVLDGWMDYITYRTGDRAAIAIEHQQYTSPQVIGDFAVEDSGVDAFRKRLWTLTMEGAYPAHGNAGAFDGPEAGQMTHWFNFFSNTRHWELEPYYDVVGGRAIALTGIEYIVYIEKPGTLELVTEKQNYQVYWYNPLTGESVQVKKAKEYKGELFTGQPPDLTHDWVLHLSRDGRKANMLERWYFESRRVPVQEIDLDPKGRPFDVAEPSSPTLPVGKPVPFSVKLTREARATQEMLYLWTAEVAGGGEGFRVIALGAEGEFTVPESIVKRMPANVNVRLFGMNAFGKVYSLTRVYNLTQE